MPSGPVDGIGSPLDARSWLVLCEAVKATVSAIRIAQAARFCAASPETFRSVVYRREMPGFGARARLATVIQFRPRAEFTGASPQGA